MDILGFIFGCAAAVFAVVGWGLAGTALARTKELSETLTALEARLAALERRPESTP